MMLFNQVEITFSLSSKFHSGNPKDSRIAQGKHCLTIIFSGWSNDRNREDAAMSKIRIPEDALIRVAEHAGMPTANQGRLNILLME